MNRKPFAYYMILTSTLFLSAIGLIMVLSASSVHAYAIHGDSYYFFKRQLLWVALGLTIMFILARVNFQKLQRMAPCIAVLTLFLLLIVLIPGIGRKAGGANRWISLGLLSFQPSEIAKFAIILFAADLIARRKKYIDNLKAFLPLGLFTLVAAALILAQPDLGTAITICLAALIVLFLGGVRLRYILGLFSALVGAAAAFIFVEPYRYQRLLAFLNPWADVRGKGYQIIQSLLAFGSGGILGVGLGMSRQKFFYLPAAYTDFIYAIIGEETGIIGTLLIVFLYGVFAFYGLQIAYRCRSFFGRLLGSAIVILICLQALINMAAVTGLMPVTGIPLPLISFGGSSVVLTFLEIGILLNISLHYQTGAREGVYESSNSWWGDSRTHLSRSGTRRGSYRKR
jgi:cell division protein FtsW